MDKDLGKCIKQSGQNEAALFTPQSRLYPYRQVRENLIAYAQR